jgi:hypothetical protein
MTYHNNELTLYRDEDILITATLGNSGIDNLELPGVFVHNALLRKLTPSIMKRTKIVWKELSEQLYKKGVPAIYAVPLEPDNEKWTERWGFKYTGITIDSYKLYKHKRSL